MKCRFSCPNERKKSKLKELFKWGWISIYKNKDSFLLSSEKPYRAAHYPSFYAQPNESDALPMLYQYPPFYAQPRSYPNPNFRNRSSNYSFRYRQYPPFYAQPSATAVRTHISATAANSKKNKSRRIQSNNKEQKTDRPKKKSSSSVANRRTTLKIKCGKHLLSFG